MKIKTLHLQHFRRFTDFPLHLHEQLTVLVARNGAGKTSVLDGIATLLGAFLTRIPKVNGINPKASDFQVLPGGRQPPYMRLTAEGFNGVKWDRTERRDKSKKTADQIPLGLGVKQLNDYADAFIDAANSGTPYELPVFIYYGTGRGVFDVPKRKRDFAKEFPRFDAFNYSLESKTNFKKFVEYFYFLEGQESRLQKAQRSFDVELPELKAIRKAIEKMMPAFSNPESAIPAGIQVDWLDNGVQKKLRIEQLSDGYRTTLAMVMDIAARMAEANPESPDPLASSGIVLIDEVDLHLHPGWQQHILLDLRRTFPNIQFVVSTHSAQVISSVKPECLRVIDWDNETPRLLNIDFSEGAEAQQVLLDILGVKSARAEQLPIVKTLTRYQRLVEADQWDTSEAVSLRQQLDDWGAEYEPELARLDMEIKMKAWERQQA